jgi:hypothetical protein
MFGVSFMAVNHADGQLIFAVPLYPLAAGVAAFHAGAGWFTILFIPVGLAIGLGVCRFGRPVVYSIMAFGLSRSSRAHSRGIQTMVVLPFFVLYMILPIAFAWGGLAGVWAGSVWLIRHLL